MFKPRNTRFSNVVADLGMAMYRRHNELSLVCSNLASTDSWWHVCPLTMSFGVLTSPTAMWPLVGVKPYGVTLIPFGALPTGTLATTLAALTSITETEFA